MYKQNMELFSFGRSIGKKINKNIKPKITSFALSFKKIGRSYKLLLLKSDKDTQKWTHPFLYQKLWVRFLAPRIFVRNLKF